MRSKHETRRKAGSRSRRARTRAPRGPKHRSSQCLLLRPHAAFTIPRAIGHAASRAKTRRHKTIVWGVAARKTPLLPTPSVRDAKRPVGVISLLGGYGELHRRPQDYQPAANLSTSPGHRVNDARPRRRRFKRGIQLLVRQPKEAARDASRR